MRVVVQRVSEARVTVEGIVIGEIGRGLMLLIGIAETDTEEDVHFVAEKCVNLRIFEDEAGKLNRSLLDVQGEVLAISQFTLLGDTRYGRRPSFIAAARPEKGEVYYQKFVKLLESHHLKVACGKFGAMMDVALINQGPVTLVVDSKSAIK